MSIFPSVAVVRPRFALCALAALYCAALRAEESAPDGASVLDAVVVTSQSPESPLTYETDPKLPRQPVPASDGADYLKTIPGFTALRNGGTNGDPVLRGLFGSRLNLLTNDGSMPGACPARMDNPLSYVAPETYDRLVVVKGPQTVQWGPGASAGTVRFEREPEHFAEPGYRVEGSLLGGSYGRNDQMLDATAGAASGYARISANRSDSDDYEDGDGRVVPSEWSKWNADVAAGWTPDANTALEFSAGSGNGDARYAGRGMDGAQFRRDSYGVRFVETDIGGVLDRIEANVFHNRANHVMDNYTLRDPNPMSAMPMPMVSNVDRRTDGGRVAATWRRDALELVTGLDAQESRHRERNAMERNGYKGMPWSSDARFDNLGAFAEATWKWTSTARWVAGLRADRASVKDLRPTASSMDIGGTGDGMDGDMNGGMDRGPMPNPTFGVTRRETLPSGFVRFEQDLAPNAGWYAGIGRVERMPDYWELFSPNMGPMGSVNAFSAIRPEKTTQLDIGAQYRGARFDAWVSAYVGRIDDYILFTYEDGGMMGQSTMAANVDARIHGAEAGVEFRPIAHWKLGATLAWAWGENSSDHRPLPQMPPLDLRLTAGYDDGRWSAGALLRAVQSQDRVAVGQGNVVGRDLGPSAGFATLALNAGYRFDAQWRLTAGIDNVFDRTYSEHLNLSGSADFGYPADPVRINEPGRLAWVKLNFAF